MRSFARKPAASTKAAAAEAPRRASIAIAPARRETAATAGAAALGTRFAFDFSDIPIRLSAPAALQPKLTVHAPGDAYEQEADRVADQVMRMPEPGSRAGAPGGHPQHGHRGVQVQGKSGPGGGAGTVAPPIVEEVLRSPGEPLDAATRAFMEPRFGRDFSGVRVHTDGNGETSADAIGAEAYTRGRDIVFARARYAPHTTPGRSLLAHELVHTIQQQSFQPATVQSQTTRKDRAQVKTPSTSAARASPSLEFPCEPQRSAYGTFQALRYAAVTNATGQQIGCEMHLRFTPGSEVDAEKIGLTQAMKTVMKGEATPIDEEKSHQMVPTEGTKVSPVGSSGIPGAGFSIDQLQGSPNPIYGAEFPPFEKPAKKGSPAPRLDALSKIAAWGIRPVHTANPEKLKKRYKDPPILSGGGQYGWRFRSEESWITQPAELHDVPKIDPPVHDSAKYFETTAVALQGNQKGLYYGSVQWGWRITASGTFEPIEFKIRSMGTPTADFMAAAQQWNASKTWCPSGIPGTPGCVWTPGSPTLPLPIIDVYKPVKPIPVGDGVQLDLETRIRKVAENLDGSWTVEVVDGPLIGKRFVVGSANARNLKKEF